MGLSEVRKRFFIVFMPLSLLLVGIAAAFYYADRESEITIKKANEMVYVNIEQEIIAGNFKSVVSDLMILSDQYELKKIFKAGEDNEKILKELADNFLSFSKREELYDQIRYIDEKGMEVTRVNYNNGKPYLVPKDRLQFKGDRYYFKDTFQLSEDEVFVSPFDLNIEKGEIEEPLKPMIRFGTPVFDSNGKKRGILILNYLGQKMIDDLKRISASLPGHVMLINSDGYFLDSRNPENNWGFMYKNRQEKIFSNFFPGVWRQILNSESGQFIGKNDLFTFTTIYPLLEGWKTSTGSGKADESSGRMIEAKKYSWKIVSYVPEEILFEKSRKLLGKLLVIYTVLFVLLAISSWSLARLSGQAVTLGKRTLSPYNVLVTVAILVFLSELFVMFILQFLTSISPMIEAVIDSTLLLVLLTPTLYYLLFRPLVLHITERKMFEEQREALIDNLNKVNTELKDFAYIVSHDLKAPLRAISSLAGWIKKDYEDVLDDEGKENLDLMLGRTRRMDKLIGGILQYSRLGRMKPELESLDSDNIVHHVIDALHPPDNILFRVDGALPKILYDRTHLEQIFQNLFSNAIKHLGKPEGEVVISCEEKDGSWKFCVRDNGVGIEEKHFERIFKIFQSLKPRDEAENTGIGLFLVKKIVEGCDGEVWVESKIGKGSAFFFTIHKSTKLS